MTHARSTIRHTAGNRARQELDQLLAQLQAASATIDADCEDRIAAAEDHAILLQDLGRRISILLHRGRIEDAAVVSANASHVARLASQVLTEAIERRAAARRMLESIEPAEAGRAQRSGP